MSEENLGRGAARATDSATASLGPSVRRGTLVKGVAWSVPAIAAVVSAPLAAASGTLKATLSIPSSVCVPAGGALPNATVTVTDDSGPVPDAAVTFMFSSSDGGAVTVGGNAYPTSGSTLVLPPGQYTLSGVTATASGTVTVTALVSTSDGRTVTSSAQSYSVCAPVTDLAVTNVSNPNGQTWHNSYFNSNYAQVLLEAPTAGLGADGYQRYYSGQTYHHVVDVKNVGTTDVPAGSVLAVDYGGINAVDIYTYYSFGAPSFSSVGAANTTPGVSAATVVPGSFQSTNPYGDMRQLWSLGVPIPAGAVVSIVFAVPVPSLPQSGGAGSTETSITARVSPPAGITESNSGNNVQYSDTIAFRV